MLFIFWVGFRANTAIFQLHWLNINLSVIMYILCLENDWKIILNRDSKSVNKNRDEVEPEVNN